MNSSVRKLLGESVRIAWAAGPRETAIMVVTTVLSIVLLVVGVLLARDLASGLVDAAPSRHGLGGLVPEVLALSAVTALIGMGSAVQSHCQRLLSELCLRHGEDRVLAVAGAAPLEAFDRPGFHDSVARATLAVRRLPTVVTALLGLLRSVAGVIGTVVALVAIQPLLLPVVLLVLLPTWLAARRRSRAFYRFAHARTPLERERAYVADLLSNRDAAQEVRAYELAGYLNERRGRLWDERLSRWRALSKRQLAFAIAADIVAVVIVAGALLGLIALTLSHDIDVAGAGVAALTIVLLAQRLGSAASLTGTLSESALYVDDYLALVESTPLEPAPPAGSPAPDRVHARAEGVTFTYPGGTRPALHDVSIEIGAGEVVALVGANGSGKTTLAKLLAGLYEPDEGQVSWNGSRPVPSGAAVIFQDFMHYSLPAGENIGLGRHERLPDDDGVRDAATRSGANEDIEALAAGYDTVLGPAFAGGVDLSLGQWQRIALARALFRDAPLVIFDEPTASLDAQAEHDLFARMQDLLEGRSVLLISHRFSSVRDADRIHVLAAGRIVESGSHDELIERAGIYSEMFELQASRYR